MALLRGRLFLSKGFIVVIQGRETATKKDCRHVTEEEGSAGGWWLVVGALQPCQTRLWLGVFMLLLSPAINPKQGSINGLLQGHHNCRNILGNDCSP